MDTIFLKDLRVKTIVGIWEWERRMPQVVSIDLEMATDVGRAAQADRIDDTLDYKAVTKRVVKFVAESRFQLVETLAERVAELIIREFAVPWVKVAVHKPFAIRGSRDVGVCIERGDRNAPRAGSHR
jgi:dihydroneopterin aldolase